MRYPDPPENLRILEEQTLERWRSESLFEQTLDATRDGAPFVFYEGPPTANGRPGLHHLISRTIKDLVCRHRTMQGRSVTRIAGWDTHGLPVEIEAERKLGISGKPDIEAVGIEKFNQVCRDSVFTYKEEWERFSERIGYWLDYSRPYVTFHTPYVESVWAILKRLAEKGLLYRGHKSVPYCPRCGTALSSHEVAQGYADIEDPSLHFLCHWVDEAGAPDPEGRSFLVWTTTPWTVPSNAALAVDPELTYAEVPWTAPDGTERRLVLAEARVEAIFGEGAGERITRRVSGRDLLGQRYSRPLALVSLDDVDPAEMAAGWRVVDESWVSADDGTGIVHMAPAFGADDHAAGQRHGFPMLRPVDDRGCFNADIPGVGGTFVKEADPALVEALREAGTLFRIESEVHSYPHCWRCTSPLIYMARDSWFAATSTVKDRMLEHNARVTWHPPEVGEGRFGEWLANNVDWALSRDRFWGTPLPVWVNDTDPGETEWIGSLAELDARVRSGGGSGLPADFDPHRPFIDDVTWPAPSGTGTMRRVPQVLDVWFDSGAMPYAQWHWPHENEEAFRAHFPADFICEGLDQTRGWFYSLMAISTMLDLGPAYRNVMVNGLILDANGQKMSKSKGNTVNPWDAIEEFGTDPLRWYLVTASNPWVPKRYDPEGVREASRKFFDTLFNSYRFFAMYAEVEGWSPDADVDAGVDAEGTGERSVLDRWLLSRLNRLVAEVGEELEAYQLTRAYRLVTEFLNEDLSNWYVRRSRARFWGKGDPADTRAAFRTLWEALVTVARLTAPVVPFTADWLHRALHPAGGSVHLTSFPVADPAQVEDGLEEEMDAVRALVSLGRAAREDVRIRVRQPLAVLHAVVPGRRPRGEVLAVLRDELNVKEVHFLDSAEGLVTLTARPNFRVLGPRFQARSELAATALRELGADALAAHRRGEPVSIRVGDDEVSVEPGWMDVVESAAGDLVVKAQDGFVAALDPGLTEELLVEGMARELVNRIQRLRKDAGLEITDRIRLGVDGPERVARAVADWGDFIAGETLAVELEAGGAAVDALASKLDDDVDGDPVRVALSRVLD
ncbi:MAG: isoleucine--tRNA ligase [Gemmatimonadales bacterium]|nr:MAG: isoleucine--tRNA ligase [Gemmatimonadales bacterium]